MGYSSKAIKRMGFDDVQPIQRSKMGNVPTWYNGVLYPCKLEARFACMLDIWQEGGVIDRWAYEEQSLIFEHTDKTGKRKDVQYIPDFWVYGMEGEDWVFETKGPVSAYDILKWECFTDNRPEKLCIVFASKLYPGKGKGISTFKFDKMERMVERVWQNANKEFKKYRNMPG